MFNTVFSSLSCSVLVLAFTMPLFFGGLPPIPGSEVLKPEESSIAKPALSREIFDLKINEIFPSPRNKNANEWVELYNPTSKDIDLSGFRIDDAPDTRAKPYTIPKGTIIPANGYWVWETHGFFDDNGDQVRLLAPDGKLIDSLSYSTTEADKSYIRLPDGKDWYFLMSLTPTKGIENKE